MHMPQNAHTHNTFICKNTYLPFEKLYYFNQVLQAIDHSIKIIIYYFDQFIERTQTVFQ